jgi:hypothetical protein
MVCGATAANLLITNGVKTWAALVLSKEGLDDNLTTKKQQEVLKPGACR